MVKNASVYEVHARASNVTTVRKSACTGERKLLLPTVVHLTHCAQLSGAELFLSRVLPRLSRYEPLVFLGEDGPLAERLLNEGIKAEILPMSYMSRDVQGDSFAVSNGTRPAVDLLRYSFSLAARLRRLKPSLIHSHSAKSHLYAGLAARMTRTPHLWQAHDRVARPGMSATGIAVLRAAAATFPNAVVGNSQETLKYLPRPLFGLREKLVVPGVIDPPTEDQILSGGQQERASFRVGHVGRLTPWKGQHLFISAFARAFANDKSCAGVIVGSPLFGEDDYERRLKRLGQDLGVAGQLTFKGFVDDVYSELRDVDVLVHSSIRPEPFGQVIAEGMAMGLPVIASREGGPLEIVKDGVNGLLVEARDDQALATALNRLREDEGLRKRLGANARNDAEKYFARNVAPQLEDVYDRVLLARHHRAARKTPVPAD